MAFDYNDHPSIRNSSLRSPSHSDLISGNENRRVFPQRGKRVYPRVNVLLQRRTIGYLKFPRSNKLQLKSI